MLTAGLNSRGQTLLHFGTYRTGIPHRRAAVVLQSRELMSCFGYSTSGASSPSWSKECWTFKSVFGQVKMSAAIVRTPQGKVRPRSRWGAMAGSELGNLIGRRNIEWPS